MGELMKNTDNDFLYFLYRCLKKGAGLCALFHSKMYHLKGKITAVYLRLVLAECGTELTVNGRPTIFEPHKVHIGDHFTINNGCQIAPRAEIYISDYVTMSRGSQIVAGTLDSTKWANEQYKKHIHSQAEVFIGEGTWLCVNSIVLPGVHITGKGVIVAAGAVVTHDITEDYVVVGGIPARVVKKLTN